MSDTTPGHGLPDIPELTNDFEFVRELGRGGTAVVYLARDRELGRDVAIKLIRPSHLQDEEAIARLEREARTVGKLQHPNIVLLLGTRRLGDHGLALILQYVPGETLKDAVRREGPLPVERARSILTDVATGLAHAHRRRIVHRDIKPENVYLDADAGVARLADFGIARAWDSDSGLTLPGTALGTPSYMAPEQVDGGDMDGRSDVYSLGLLAWEMLTGQVPWGGESLYNVIYKQKHEDLPPISQFRDDAPPSFVAVIERALRKEPKERWASAAEFLEALGTGASARGVAPAASVPAWLMEMQTQRGSGDPPYNTDTVAEEWTDSAQEAARVPNSRGGPPRLPAAASTATKGQKRNRSRRRSWLMWGGAVVGLLLVALLIEGPDAPLRTLLGGGDDLSNPELDWEEWERATDLADPAEGLGRLGLETSVQEAPESDQPGAPPGAILRVAQGAGQTGNADELLPQSIVILAEDVEGDRLPGVAVMVEVAEGGGSVIASGSVTDSQGLIGFLWRLGTEGTQTAQVRFPDSEANPLEISAMIRDPAAQLTLEPEDLSPEPDPSPETPPQPETAPTETAATLPPPLSPRPAVAGGGNHSCLLDQTGAVYCWGGGSRGQLGLGDGARRDGPTRIPGSFARLAVGISHTCALDEEGTAFCWGANDRGQIGDGTTQARTAPTPVPDLPPLLEITAGANHTCALDTQGRAHCWGAGGQGQLGDGIIADRAGPVIVAGGRNFRQLEAGWEHTCGLDAQGQAFCWGAGGEGQLGQVGLGSGAVPASVQGNHRFTRIAPGNAHTCGLTTDGVVLCWGQGSLGQLGDGSDGGARPAPAPVAGDERFRDVTAGALHTCALTAEGEVRCWGGNVHGQVGDGTSQNRAVPTPVAGDVRLTSLQGLGSHTCGFSMAGGTICWGYNADGQLGDGSRTNRSSPTALSGSE